jgi:hypothetical protein
MEPVLAAMPAPGQGARMNARDVMLALFIRVRTIAARRLRNGIIDRE